MGEWTRWTVGYFSGAVACGIAVASYAHWGGSSYLFFAVLAGFLALWVAVLAVTDR